jgi:hypothetical protein
MSKSGGNVCTHIINFYSSTVGDPALYCIINTEDLINFDGFKNAVFEKSLSFKGDDCHVDIKGIADKHCRNFVLAYYKAPNIYLCCKEKLIELTNENIEDLIAFIEPCIEKETQAVSA